MIEFIKMILDFLLRMFAKKEGAPLQLPHIPEEPVDEPPVVEEPPEEPEPPIEEPAEPVTTEPEVDLTEPIIGIDISKYQQDIVWDEVTVDFIYIKASEGQDFIDLSAEAHGLAAQAAGKKFGYYHFATPKEGDAKLEARDFVKALNSLPVGTLPPVLDLEQNKTNLTKAKMEQWSHDFLEEVLLLTGVKCALIYGSPGFLDSNLPADHTLGKYGLWLAHYTTRPEPRLPKGWDSYLIWQHTDKGVAAGFPKPVDMNRSTRSLFAQ